MISVQQALAASGQPLLGARCWQAAPAAAGRLRHCRQGWQWRVCASSSSSAAAGGGAGQQKQLTILHFNDVYNIESRPAEPVGGAARFAAAAKRYAGERPLVLFSGDCLNPSLMSAFTRGEQMVQVLNNIGVHCAAVGNHDFDFGVPTLQSFMESGFRFPWLLSNVLDARTGQPLGGAHRTRIIDWHGVRVGLMGLVEREWLLTIPSIEEKDIQFVDFCEEGRRLATELAEQGAELIVALTHMRTPNDLVLAANVPEIQLILGGHDHHYEISRSEPHGTLVFKSGTDFREFSIIRLGVPASLAERPAVDFHRVEINSKVPEDPEMAGIVQSYMDLIGTKMDEPLGWTHTDLDARFDTVRREESNIGSMFADIMRISLGADIAFFNGGTIRSDQIHSAGQLLMRDFVSMLPFTDELVLLELSGADVLVALETGVGSWPALEGRFLQVSGLTFNFDGQQPAGSRVLPGSVRVAGRPLELEQKYKVATKAYLRGGKDGFESLKNSRVLVDGETNPRLATLVQYLWMRVEQLNVTLNAELRRMLAREEEAAAAALAEEAEHPHASVSSIDGWEHRDLQPAAAAHHHQQQQQQQEAAARGGSNGSNGSTVAVAAAAAAVYAPGDPATGSVIGWPGSIPHEVEERVHEVSSTGAAISLALLLQQRSEQQEAGGNGSTASSSQLMSLSEDEGERREARRHSSAALSALSYLDPCTHGLDELIVFDAIRRKFGIAPQTEGRIRRVQQADGGI